MSAPIVFTASLGQLSTTSIVETAIKAEDLGYYAVSLPDHLDNQTAPLIGLAAVAQATRTIRLLPLVLANDYRHPVILAKELASLDALSGGRIIAGLGAGWMKTDYDLSGIPLDSPGTRIARLGESVRIVTALLRGETVDHQGEHYRVAGSLGTPHAIQSPIPVMLAGGKQKMLTLAGSAADIVGINPGLTAGVIDERAGRDATLEQTDQKLQWVRDAAGDRFESLTLQTRIHLAMLTDDREGIAQELAPLLGLTPEQALSSPHALVGTVEQCVETVLGWRERWGISMISIDANQMDDFAPVLHALEGQ